MQTDIVCILGTRPEIIKLAPVIDALRADGTLSLRVILSGQHVELATPFVDGLALGADENLAVHQDGDDYAAFADRVAAALAPRLEALAPRAVIVQGDTSTAFAGALAASRAGIPVIHVEAGLRTHDPERPYPEEALRTRITHIADLHCAPTATNRRNLLDEGIAAEAIVVCGNPVVDAVNACRDAGRGQSTAGIASLLDDCAGLRRIVLTAHRRENLGARMRAYFQTLADFVASQPGVCLIFPVHPNPHVRELADAVLAGRERIRLIAPLDYAAFLTLAAAADLLVSDSGGIQEEAASLGVPLVVLREVTERPEVIAAGFARLAPDAAALASLLDAFARDGWPARQTAARNPFGDGDSGARIAAAVRAFLAAR